MRIALNFTIVETAEMTEAYNRRRWIKIAIISVLAAVVLLLAGGIWFLLSIPPVDPSGFPYEPYAPPIDEQNLPPIDEQGLPPR